MILGDRDNSNRASHKAPTTAGTAPQASGKRNSTNKRARRTHVDFFRKSEKQQGPKGVCRCMLTECSLFAVFGSPRLRRNSSWQLPSGSFCPTRSLCSTRREPMTQSNHNRRRNESQKVWNATATTAHMKPSPRQEKRTPKFTWCQTLCQTSAKQKLTSWGLAVFSSHHSEIAKPTCT